MSVDVVICANICATPNIGVSFLGPITVYRYNWRINYKSGSIWKSEHIFSYKERVYNEGYDNIHFLIDAAKAENSDLS